MASKWERSLCDQDEEEADLRWRKEEEARELAEIQRQEKQEKDFEQRKQATLVGNEMSMIIIYVMCGLLNLPYTQTPGETNIKTLWNSGKFWNTPEIIESLFTFVLSIPPGDYGKEFLKLLQTTKTIGISDEMFERVLKNRIYRIYCYFCQILDKIREVNKDMESLYVFLTQTWVTDEQKEEVRSLLEDHENQKSFMVLHWLLTLMSYLYPFIKDRKIYIPKLNDVSLVLDGLYNNYTHNFDSPIVSEDGIPNLHRRGRDIKTTRDKEILKVREFCDWFFELKEKLAQLNLQKIEDYQFAKIVKGLDSWYHEFSTRMSYLQYSLCYKGPITPEIVLSFQETMKNNPSLLKYYNENQDLSDKLRFILTEIERKKAETRQFDRNTTEISDISDQIKALQTRIAFLEKSNFTLLRSDKIDVTCVEKASKPF